MSAVSNFTLSADDFSVYGHGLLRPECVWADSDGVWVSDARGGVSHIGENGNARLLGDGIIEANGFSRRRNGTFVVAGLGDGMVHEVNPNGETKVLLSTVDGRPLGAVNCAWVDKQDRVWVSIMTRRPRWYDALNDEPDGYIVLIDASGARVVAEGLHLTNEVKLHPDGKHLYVAETLAMRIVRFPVHQDGTLGAKEIVGPANLGYGGTPDGFAFDAEGNVWVILINRNAIVVIMRDGSLHTVFEEVNQTAISSLVNSLESRTASIEQMAPCAGRTLSLPTSLAFGGEDGRTVYIGSLPMPYLKSFRAPVAGAGF